MADEVVDPILDELYRAAMKDEAARGPLADYLEEHGADPETLKGWEGPLDVLLAVRAFNGCHFGYWSSQAAKEFGHAVYRTPEGEQAGVTFVVTMPSDVRDYGWPDIVPVGRVTEHIRSYQGTFNFA